MPGPGHRFRGASRSIRLAIGFSSLLPLPKRGRPSRSGASAVQQQPRPGHGGLAGGLEPVRLLVEGRQLVLEAGRDDRWLVSDLDPRRPSITAELNQSKEHAKGLQFIAIQSSPEEQAFAGFWMMRDIATL